MAKWTFSNVKNLEEFLKVYEDKNKKKPRVTGRVTNGRITFTARA